MPPGREILPPDEALCLRYTLCMARKFNEVWRKKFRLDGPPRHDKHPFCIWYTTIGKGVLFMRKAEAREDGAAQVVTAVVLGGLLALGVALTVLLLGAAAVSNGIIKEDAAAQVTAAACVAGCFAGGLLACTRCGSGQLFVGLAVGGVCCLLIAAVGLLMGDGLRLGAQALIELAGCLCGGAIAGMLRAGRPKKKRAAARKK